MSNLFDFTLWTQLLSAILSCVYLLSNKNNYVKILTFLLVVTFMVELSGAYLNSEANFSIYHYYTLFQYYMIFFLYRDLIKHKKQLIPSYVFLLFFTIAWGMIFYDQKFFIYAIILGALNVGFLIFLHLKELLLSDEVINFKKVLPFWVSVGFFVFYIPSIPFFSFLDYMKNRDLFPILKGLILLMNLIISFGLIWSYKKEKSY